MPVGSEQSRKKRACAADIQVGSQIRIRRMLLGMSQEQLGELLGVTFQQIQKYEKGVNRIGAGRLFDVANILRVPIRFFFEGVGGPSIDKDISNEGLAPTVEFLFTAEGLQLALAFQRIRDPKVRRRVIELIESLAGETQEHHIRNAATGKK